MKQDTRDFLIRVLWDAESVDLEGEPNPCKDKTPDDFSPEFVEAAEAFIDGFRAYLVREGVGDDVLTRLECSFGGNVYWSLSGAGVGFFDDADPECAALHERLKAYSGDRYRFEELNVNIMPRDGDGKLDLAVIAEALPERRRKLFEVAQ